VSKFEWYFIGIINLAACEYVTYKDSPAFWRWHNSRQHDEWIGHKDGPNRHPDGWPGWMAEFV